MQPTQEPRSNDAPSVLGTLGWVGVVVVCALVAILVLSWLGPVGGK